MSTEFSDSSLTINLSAIANNYKILKEKAGNAECAAVVKANAYGLGIKEVTHTLIKAGCQSFFVATLDEALELREISLTEDIYIFHGVRAGQEELIKNNSLIPILNSKEQIHLWNKHASKMRKRLPAVIHVDTGMNRLGLNIEEAKTTANGPSLDNLEVKYVMSHLACSSENSEMNKQQLNLFKEIRGLFPDIPATFSNSSGIFLGKEYHFDLVRAGVALYGVNPTPETDNPMQNVVTLKAKILQIREVKELQTVGYGATVKVNPNSRLATIPVGYADGYLRSLSNNGICYIGDKEVPIIGRVSMDLIVLDITQLSDDEACIGTEVELIGGHVPVDLVAKQAGTIGYEILTSLGLRYNRDYIG
jgi:alanine racemase